MVGRDTAVDALQVSTQSEKKMTLEEFADYFELPPSQRIPLYNV